MLVGPTGGGKTTIRKILRKSLVLLPSFHGSEDEEIATIDGSEMTSLVAQQVRCHCTFLPPNKLSLFCLFAVNECFRNIEQVLKTVPGSYSPSNYTVSPALIS